MKQQGKKPKISVEDLLSKIEEWASDLSYSAEWQGDPCLETAEEMIKYVKEVRSK